MKSEQAETFAELATPDQGRLMHEYALWCYHNNPTMYDKMCWWHHKAMALQAAQPTAEQYAQAARQIAEKLSVYNEADPVDVERVLQILHSTLGQPGGKK
jgi:hypothetical protein